MDFKSLAAPKLSGKYGEQNVDFFFAYNEFHSGAI